MPSIYRSSGSTHAHLKMNAFFVYVLRASHVVCARASCSHSNHVPAPQDEDDDVVETDVVSAQCWAHVRSRVLVYVSSNSSNKSAHLRAAVRRTCAAVRVRE